MYSLLLVDDEKRIRQGVSELLMLENLELDITTASSAQEALSVLENRKVDLAILDICMPQMSGMDLYDVIRERWPYCKLIFLSGHLEFEYVYKIHRHARYVLKMEDDRKLVEAVQESINELENDLLLQQATSDLSHSKQRRLYYERNLLLHELVETPNNAWNLSRESMEHCCPDLDLERDVYCVMLRCRALQTMSYPQFSEVLEHILTFVEKYYLEAFPGTYFGYRHSLLYLLLQPKKDLGREKNLTQLVGITELLQKAVNKNLGIPLSALLRDRPLPFEKAIGDFIALKDSMLNMQADEIRVGRVGSGKEDGELLLSGSVKRELSLKVAQLDSRFDNMDQEGILAVLDELREKLKAVTDMKDLFAMEMYGSVCAKLLSYVQRVGMEKHGRSGIPLRGLYEVSRYTSWAEAFSELRRVVVQVFTQVDTTIESKNEDVVNRIKYYIQHHLDGDTSLYALSEQVHLCQEHLLRVFKKQEGVTVLQYINDLRITRAKQMLVQTDMQIKDIATELGFASAGYFGRFFKSKMGITPNAYREQKQLTWEV